MAPRSCALIPLVLDGAAAVAVLPVASVEEPQAASGRAAARMAVMIVRFMNMLHDRLRGRRDDDRIGCITIILGCGCAVMTRTAWR